MHLFLSILNDDEATWEFLQIIWKAVSVTWLGRWGNKKISTEHVWEASNMLQCWHTRFSTGLFGRVCLPVSIFRLWLLVAIWLFIRDCPLFKVATILGVHCNMFCEAFWKEIFHFLCVVLYMCCITWINYFLISAENNIHNKMKL